MPALHFSYRPGRGRARGGGGGEKGGGEKGGGVEGSMRTVAEFLARIL